MSNNRTFLPGNWTDKEKTFQEAEKSHKARQMVKEIKRQAKELAKQRTMAQKNKNNLMAAKYATEEENSKKDGTAG